MMNEDFADVTLVTEDKKQIKANATILSACSPVFKDVFKKDNRSSTIMYLRGIQYSEMEPIMQFIYLGEATFYEERMDEFLAVAQSLEVKELCNAKPEKNDEQDDEPRPSDPKILTNEVEEETTVSDQREEPALQERRRGVVNVSSIFECEQCHKTYNSRGALYNHKKSVHEGVKYACLQCDYQATEKSYLIIHIQSKHEGIKYACGQCDHQASQKGDLTKHIQAKHEGVRYACDQCDYKATWQGNLTAHIQAKHERVRYGCSQCDFQATQQSDLTKHIQSKHEGVKYACGQCDYQAGYQSDLTKHTKSKHEGVKYECDQCDYQANYQSNLTQHKRTVH